MKFYEELPTDVMLQFYKEFPRNIEEGIITKNMYDEVGLIISVANKRGIDLDKPADYEQVIDPQFLCKLVNEKYTYAV